jgi:uncharacterized membrane protein YhdT/uncharacterized Zn-finger protein
MSRFREELRVIPRAAWIVAGILYVALVCLIAGLLVFSDDPGLREMPVTLKMLMLVFPPLLMFVFIVLIGYVYGDAKRRQMRYVMWTLLAIFIPDAIGIILYFILRDALPKPCAGCAQPLKAGFVFCPMCGTAVQASCPNCGRGVEAGWSHCPHCGSKLPSSALQTS